jgi:hypothetical protein
MKKNLTIPFLAILFLTLSSWGPEGHSTIALIAQNHLTPKARSAVNAILGNQPMSSISSWADEIRPTQPATAGWHFLNLELGLNADQFRQATISQQAPNVYSQLLRLIKELSNAATPQSQKLIDLKFLVHFVGDAHQPMHISRAEDRGGNDIIVTYDNQNTNIHKVWDSLILGDDQPNFTQLAAKVDHATPAQIQEWQASDIVQWVWESYQISSKVYGAVHNGTVLTKSYTTANIPIAEMRLEMGGIRLAGVLNTIFK